MRYPRASRKLTNPHNEINPTNPIPGSVVAVCGKVSGAATGAVGAPSAWDSRGAAGVSGSA